MAKLRILGGIVATLCASIATIAPASAGAVTPVIEYNLPNNHLVSPIAITQGPDGNMWFTTEFDPFPIGRITSWGEITEFSVSRGFTNITTGPDGNIWYCSDGITHEKELAGDFSEIPMLVRLTTTGVETDFPIPHSCLTGGLTVGPDRNLWYEAPNDGITGRMTLAGEVTEFPLGGYDITSGADGNLWIANGDITYKVSTAGVLLNTYAGGGSHIAAGPNGTIWTTGGSSIGRLTIATGQVDSFPGHGPITDSITQGPDGAMWYTFNNNYGGPSGVNRMTTDGVVTDHILVTAGFSQPKGIAVGPVPANKTNAGVRGQKALWFTEALVNRIGVIKANSPK